ncbi:hypothetical protein PR202_gb15112 [Eleusine coracana subsp. coracana]|uniref:Uncharacterized protein n=1 Tax=Eleusine coracana subsp. coracana TaxID=191504 RepID=A0AAV5EY57_ELECO|nr:hypothetical protein PR202_gb15112 [Eleusine coracana subsp. coracana]
MEFTKRAIGIAQAATAAATASLPIPSQHGRFSPLSSGSLEPPRATDPDLIPAGERILSLLATHQAIGGKAGGRRFGYHLESSFPLRYDSATTPAELIPRANSGQHGGLAQPKPFRSVFVADGGSRDWENFVLFALRSAQISPPLLPEGGDDDEDERLWCVGFLNDSCQSHREKLTKCWWKMASTACFLIVSKNDIPIYEAEVGSAPKKEDLSYHHQFILHAALDVVQDLAWTTSAMFLKSVDRFNDLVVSVYLILFQPIILAGIYDTIFCIADIPQPTLPAWLAHRLLTFRYQGQGSCKEVSVVCGRGGFISFRA